MNPKKTHNPGLLKLMIATLQPPMHDYQVAGVEQLMKMFPPQEKPVTPKSAKPHPIKQDEKMSYDKLQQNSPLFTDVDIISMYTRKQAIEDGVLVDMNQGEFGKRAKENGINYPIAMTSSAFGQYVALTKAAKAMLNDEMGRWQDILTMFKIAVRNPANRNSEQFLFEFRCVVRSRRPSLCQLKAVVGPGDAGEPVLTFMLPDED